MARTPTTPGLKLVQPKARNRQNEQFKATNVLVDKLDDLRKEGMSGETLLTSQLLICCGLPIRRVEDHTVIRSARLGDGTFVRVIFHRSSPDVPIAFGSDRTMIFYMTDKAVRNEWDGTTKELTWKHSSEYMARFNVSRSGENYIAMQQRFHRLINMGITVEITNPATQRVRTLNCRLIETGEMSADVNANGEWKPTRSLTKILSRGQEIKLGHTFVNELLKDPIPIPMELIRVAGKRVRLMDYLVYCYWRSFVATKESFIEWHHLRKQFDDTDNRDRRWPELFHVVKNILESMPRPFSSVHMEVSGYGIRIFPLAPEERRFASERIATGSRP